MSDLKPFDFAAFAAHHLGVPEALFYRPPPRIRYKRPRQLMGDLYRDPLQSSLSLHGAVNPLVPGGEAAESIPKRLL